MTDNQYNKLEATLLKTRGEKGCDEALTKLKANFKVSKVRDIPTDKTKAILDKLLKENITPVCECGGGGTKKGNFHICLKCRSIL